MIDHSIPKNDPFAMNLLRLSCLVYSRERPTGTILRANPTN